VTESLLLALLGGALGVALARGGGDALAAALSTGDGALGVTAALNPRVLAFSLALCVLTGLLFGLAPALRATGLDLATALRASGAAARGSGFRIGKALITVQVALSLVMVVGSALFVRTLLNLRSERLGFRPEGLLLFQLNPTLNGYKGERLYAFHQGVVEALESVPGVVSASMSRYGLLSGGRTSDGIQLAGQPDISVRIHYVAPRFFETLSFPMLAGRDLAWSDREGSPRVAVVNQALASRLWGERNPIGEQALMSGASLEVVGLASDTKFDTLRQAAPPTVYLPYRQNFASSMTFVVRTDGDPRRLVEAVRRTVAALDPQVPPYAIRTQAEQIDLAMRRERVFAALLSGFALLTLGLAGLGVYGTLAYLAARRTPEIGVRVALGAGRGRIVRLILGESSAPVLLGIAIGLWSALAAGRLVSGMLFGLQPQDTASLAASAAILLACALAAGLVPAWRASRIAPVEALRC
jgi:predicted permease